jgi:hypothetical protein
MIVVSTVEAQRISSRLPGLVLLCASIEQRYELLVGRHAPYAAGWPQRGECSL